MCHAALDQSLVCRDIEARLANSAAQTVPSVKVKLPAVGVVIKWALTIWPARGRFARSMESGSA